MEETIKKVNKTSGKEMNDFRMIEAFSDPLFFINADGLIIQMNSAALTITGATKDDLLNTYLFDHFSESQKAFELYREIFSKGSVPETPLTLKHLSGSLTDVLFNSGIYRDEHGDATGAIVIARDITAQKKFENELIEAKKHSEQARQAAEQASKAKQQFLSNMSHEMRTPLNAIIGFTKVVLKTNLDEKQKEYLNAIKISGDALIVLINDILDLAKVEAGKMTFEKTPFKLISSVSAMLHLFENRVHNKNVELVKEFDSFIPEILVGDPIRLHQVILNLVSNAVKFTQKGKITFAIRLLNEDKEKITLEFSVADTGIGIQEDQLENIFDNFHQASSKTARLYGGTGLGLAIVKQLIESQGGSLWVKSKVDVGSTFTFILTFRKIKNDQKAEEEIKLPEKNEAELKEPGSAHKKAKILVVEDVTLNQLLMKTLLEEFGFEMEIASNGKIAIEKLKKENFDLILMDLQMPEMNGFEATHYIRNELHSQIPIIALTADVTTADVEKCRAVGMDDYIAKPIQDKLLHNKILKFIKKPGTAQSESGDSPVQVEKVVNLDYLRQHTQGNEGMIEKMVDAYIQETPTRIEVMKKSIDNMDWESLQKAAHSIIPSFAIMGMSKEFENMAKTIQEYAKKKEGSSLINDYVLKIEEACRQACNELIAEFRSQENI